MNYFSLLSQLYVVRDFLLVWLQILDMRSSSQIKVVCFFFHFSVLGKKVSEQCLFCGFSLNHCECKLVRNFFSCYWKDKNSWRKRFTFLFNSCTIMSRLQLLEKKKGNKPWIFIPTTDRRYLMCLFLAYFPSSTATSMFQGNDTLRHFNWEREKHYS